MNPQVEAEPVLQPKGEVPAGQLPALPLRQRNIVADGVPLEGVPATPAARADQRLHGAAALGEGPANPGHVEAPDHVAADALQRGLQNVANPGGVLAGGNKVVSRSGLRGWCSSSPVCASVTREAGAALPAASAASRTS
eukprot:CAMPEP_0176097940 /NCGR_PEP_ID=MMETSP0120_2-20121206/49106_1 /TAXON_ID=160619 /ORGANISM="Kryptoperidinium foliaceum, Strain CCMP 1326" /LENGTH=138 /DNA_ID=CAMNT_0017431945 /DNA_START=98 /DNA_END=513 /DNA_ORIENTATION=-